MYLICLLYPPGRWSCSWQSIQFQRLWHGSLSPSQRRHSGQGYSTQPTSGTTKGFRFHQKEVCWPCKKDWYNIPRCIPTRLPHFQHLLLDYIQNYTAWGHSQEIGYICLPGLLSQSNPHVNKQWNVFLSFGLRVSSPPTGTLKKWTKKKRSIERKVIAWKNMLWDQSIKILPLYSQCCSSRFSIDETSVNGAKFYPTLSPRYYLSKQKRIRKQTILLKHLPRDCDGYSTVSYKRTKLFQDNVAFLFETSLLSYIP